MAATTVKAIGVVIAVVTGIGVVGLHPRQPPPGPARGRRGDRARAQPQAVLRRRAARGPAPQPGAGQRPGAHRDHRGGPPALLAQRARPADRRHRELRPDLHQPGQPPVRAHRGGWLQLRRLPRLRGRRRPGAAVHAHQRRRGVRRHGHLAGPGPQHRAPALLRGGAARDPRLRPARHPDAGVGHRGRRPAHHPADRRADRLHRLDPAHLRRGQGGGREARCATSWASPRTPRSTGTTPPPARCCSTSAWRTASPAAPTPAPAATPRARRSSTARSSRRTPTSATTPGSPTARARSASRSPAA